MAMWRRVTPKYLLWALAGVATAGLVLLVLWGGPWLFTRHPSSDLTDAEALKAENDVRTALVQAVAGLAVASGAIVTYRTFRHTRLEQDRAYKLSQSQQVTESYAKAVEQLGHAEAPVRLGAMYSLERLAQDNPPRRQTIVDVLCAYLRMPFTPSPHGESAADPGNDGPPWVTEPATVSAPRHDPAQELQVRQTAQRLLADHLRRPLDLAHEDAQRINASPEETFWPGISLDLTGATLVDFDLRGRSVIGASFTKVTFSGAAWFNGAIFSDVARFDQVTFSGAARFNEVTFSDVARFNEATFSDVAVFGGATFAGAAWFERATFSDAARFNQANFSDAAGFGGVRVLHLDDDPDPSKGGENARRVWPEGWTVRPDADDPSRGTLIPPPQGLTDASTRGCP
jgi:hypothetical protein